MSVATWNVNSIKARLANLLRWLEAAKPDVVLLQETKVQDEAFPAEPIEDLGYNIARVGQKSYNGVAVLSKRPIDVLATALPGDDADAQARYLEVFTGGLRVASLYAPNGNPVESEKFAYKLGWLERLHRHAAVLLAEEDALVLGGDLNVALTDQDVFDPPAWREDALCRPESRAALWKILHLGFVDAARALDPDGHAYTYWDYRGNAWAADLGLRIDYLLLSPRAADRLIDAACDRTPRGWPQTSDHAPVVCRLRTA